MLLFRADRLPGLNSSTRTVVCCVFHAHNTYTRFSVRKVIRVQPRHGLNSMGAYTFTHSFARSFYLCRSLYISSPSAFAIQCVVYLMTTTTTAVTAVTLHHIIRNARRYCKTVYQVCIIMNLKHFICFVKVISSAINVP